MPEDAAYQKLKAEIEVMRRQLAMVMKKTGITVEEQDESELAAVLDRASATRDYKTIINDYLNRKKTRRAA